MSLPSAISHPSYVEILFSTFKEYSPSEDISFTLDILTLEPNGLKLSVDPFSKLNILEKSNGFSIDKVKVIKIRKRMLIMIILLYIL